MRYLSWATLLHVSLIATSDISGQVPDSTAARAAAPPRAQQTRLLEALTRNRLALTMDDGRPSGPGWDLLVREASNARFTLIGEEPGVAETAQLSAALFTALRGSGYSRFVAQLSPIIAQDIEVAARRNGVQGIVEFLTTPGVSTFSNLREEAELFADVVKVGPTGERVLWGFDREVFSDRYLIARLESRVPPRAREAFTRLQDASTKTWATNPVGDDLFLMSGDPALASAVRAAWPNADPESDAILRTLEASLAIEAAERTGGLWPYVQRRTQWNRDNMAALLRAEQGRPVPPKVMMKFGYLSMIRGADYLNVFNLGAMADEVAALTGDRALHVLVLPGPGSRQASAGPGGTATSISSDESDPLGAGDQRLTRALSNADATGHEVIDLRPLRRLAMRGLESWNSDLVRTIHGYDVAVIWKGARASRGLLEPKRRQ
jgi:hypothetical protein